MREKLAKILEKLDECILKSKLKEYNSIKNEICILLEDIAKIEKIEKPNEPDNCWD